MTITKFAPNPIIKSLTVAGITAAAMTLSASAIAQESGATDSRTSEATGFTVATASSPLIRKGAVEFKNGDYAKSIAFSQAAIKAKMSKRKSALAYSNLCAAYGAVGQLSKASEACDTALRLRPDFAPARTNQSTLTVRLASATPKTAGGAE